MEINWLNKIDDYLDDKLSPSVRDEMDEALKADPVLQRELRISRQERIAMDMLKEEKARAEFARWTADQRVPAPPVSGKNKTIRGLGILAVLFLLGASVWLFFKQQSQSKAPAPFEPLPQVQDSTPDAPIAYVPDLHTTPRTPPIPNGKNQRPLPRTNTDAPTLTDVPSLAANLEEEAREWFDEQGSSLRGNRGQDKLSEADALYRHQEYLQAITVLNTVPKSDETYLRALFLKAFALFKTRQYGLAADVFAQVYADPDNEFSLEPKWREALCLYADGGQQKARLESILKNLLAEDFPLKKKEKARIMLEKIK